MRVRRDQGTPRPTSTPRIGATPAVTSTPTPGSTGSSTTTTSDAFHAGRDMRTRVGVSAVQAGPTTTATPKLLDDWRSALLEAAAEDLADAEVLAPVRDKALAEAEADKGEPLSRQETRAIGREVFKLLKADYEGAKQAHHKDLTKSPSTSKQTERDVLMAHRSRVDQLRDVFSPVAQRLPGARDHELVLWENQNAMVLVDTFAPSPKALVVPKQPVSLPIDAAPVLLDELAVLAAHVSDAFMRATGSPPAGVWINPPQHLTVKQMHLHVLPDLGPFTKDGAPAKAFLEDPQFRPQLEAFFAGISRELEARLGPAT
jgi:diadenosine tetraphosphate (Ap4A) HIT family hydrolase